MPKINTTIEWSDQESAALDGLDALRLATEAFNRADGDYAIQHDYNAYGATYNALKIALDHFLSATSLDSSRGLTRDGILDRTLDNGESIRYNVERAIEEGDRWDTR